MDSDVVSKFVGKRVVVEIKEKEGEDSFVVKGELSWDNCNTLENTDVTIEGEGEAISVSCLDIANIREQ